MKSGSDPDSFEVRSSRGETAERPIPYSAIVDRPPLKLPDGARIAVWTIVNVEEWSIERNMPRTVLPPPYGQPLQPDLPNWAWHEYGMRVGFWRFFEVLQNIRLEGNARDQRLGDARAIRASPKAALEAGWEFMGHGCIQRPMHHVEDQKEAIADTVAAIKAFTGKKPRGWESPGLTETYETIDYLAEAGIEYVADWVLDDQPCVDQDRARPDRLGALHGGDERHRDDGAAEPSVRGMAAARHRPVRPPLHARARRRARVMAISVHPYITGVPHRIGYLEKLYEYILQRPGVSMWTGEQILDWYSIEAHESSGSRAEALLPKLKERAPKCEELRRLPDETLRDFHDARALPHPPAQARRRRRARVRRGGDLRRAARARLRLDVVELGQLRRAPPDARHVPAAGAGRDLGQVARRADRLVVRVPRRPRRAR